MRNVWQRFANEYPLNESDKMQEWTAANDSSEYNFDLIIPTMRALDLIAIVVRIAFIDAVPN